jgi:GTP-binding protein
MEVPSVVIVGRSNVGKSSLFNALCGERVAIVEPTPGVTRDRLSRVVHADDVVFELWDTGGMGLQDSQELADDIERQIRFAIDRADLVLFVVDGKAGRQPMDESIARELRHGDRRAIIVVNKCDSLKDELGGADFHALGFDDLHCVSATHRRGTGALIDMIAEALPDTGPALEADRPVEPMKIAIVGRRNVGKSTLVNYLAKEPRVIVSEVPGTTRDAVDVRFVLDGLEFVAIDTAGLRRTKQLKDNIDFYSMTRARRSILRADVVVHLMDAPSEVSRLDKQLADEVTANHKPCILVVNKMDLAGGVTDDEFRDFIRARLPGVAYAPVLCVSGLTGLNVVQLIETAQVLHEQSLFRATTATLWRVVQEAVSRNHPRSTRSRAGRIYFATQVGVKPPTIVLFANYAELITENYQRYLANQLRQHLPYSSIPIRFIVRSGHRPDDRDGEHAR